MSDSWVSLEGVLVRGATAILLRVQEEEGEAMTIPLEATARVSLRLLLRLVGERVVVVGERLAEGGGVAVEEVRWTSPPVGP